jgi:quercetin dioxygenase-like cupin family protein
VASEEAEAAAPSAFEVWNDYDPSMRFVTAYPMTAAQGTESSTIAYFAFEPGQHSGLHADDAEELIYVASGEGEVFVSGVQKRLEAGSFVHIPNGVEHDIYAYGGVTLRLLSFYPSARVESRYTEVLLPFHDHVLASDMAVPGAMPQLEEIDFDDLPPELAQTLGWQTVGGEDGPESAADEAAADEGETEGEK